MAKAVGIDLGSHALKIAAVENHGKAFRLTQFFDQPVPRTPEEGTTTRLAAHAFKELKLPRDTVTLGFDAYAAIVREMTVPFKNPDQIRKIIKFESEGQLFSFGIDEVVIDFVRVRENPDSSDLVVLAVVKDLLAEKLRVLEDAYVDPLSVDIDLLAHFNTLSITPYPDENQCLVLVDIGYKATKIMVVESGKPVLLRGLRAGMGSIVSAVQHETALALPAAEAKVMKRLPEVAGELTVEGPDEEVMVVLPDDEDMPDASDIERSREDLEDELLIAKTAAVRARIVREINRSLAGLNTEHPPEIILVTGGGSRLPGMLEAIEETLEMPTRLFKPLDHVEHALSDEQCEAAEPFASAAIGLALKQIGADASGTEFRREELAFRKRFEQVKVPLIACLMLLLVFLGLVLYRFRSDYNLRSKEYDVLNWQVVHTLANKMEEPEFQRYVDPARKNRQGEPAVVLSRISKDRLNRHNKLRAKLRAVRKARDREMGQMSESDQHYCALDTWNEMFRCIVAAQRGMGTDLSPIIPYVRINEDGIDTNMIVRDSKHTYQLKLAFGKSELLEMGEPKTDAPAPDVDGENPRLLKQLRFTFQSAKKRP